MTGSPASPLSAALQAGIKSISRDESVVFTSYTKTVVSDDGYVFWVRGVPVTVTGSLHMSSNTQQDEDQTWDLNAVVFTTSCEIDAFNNPADNTIWVADYMDAKVSFSGADKYYGPAGVWHYTGQTIFPSMQSQLIDNVSDLPTGPIVSNSLPIWLANTNGNTAYPSFLTPNNAVPPYIAVHVEPDSTQALQGAPTIVMPMPTNPLGTTLYEASASQLLCDRVRLTLYGFTSQQAEQYLISLYQFSLDSDSVGFMDSPAVHDEKQAQPESLSIAMKKTIDMQVSYNLSTADAIARRYILSAAVQTTREAA